MRLFITALNIKREVLLHSEGRMYIVNVGLTYGRLCLFFLSKNK